MRVKAVLLIGVLVFGVAACGSGGVTRSPDEPSTSTASPTTTLSAPSDSGYLRDFASGKLHRSAVVPTTSGLLVMGGSPEGAEGALAPVRDATVVHADGSVTVLAKPPGGPIADLSGSAHGDAVHLVGTRCSTGRIQDDTSALDCDPGDPVLLHLDLSSAKWTELSPPDDAPAPGGFLGDQAVYTLDGALVYQVKDAIGPDGRLSAWVSSDDGKTWKPMPDEPAGAFCAADGELLSVESADHPPEPDETGATGMTNDPDTPLGMTVRTFDVAEMQWGPGSAAPDAVPVVGGATSRSCVPDIGVVAFTLTGDTSGAVVVYSVNDGWNIVTDPEGARWMAALPSMGSGVLIPQMGSDDLVRIDASGQRSTVPFPADATPVAGIGEAVFIRTASGDPAVITR